METLKSNNMAVTLFQTNWLSVYLHVHARPLWPYFLIHLLSLSCLFHTSQYVVFVSSNNKKMFQIVDMLLSMSFCRPKDYVMLSGTMWHSLCLRWRTISRKIKLEVFVDGTWRSILKFSFSFSQERSSLLIYAYADGTSHGSYGPRRWEESSMFFRGIDSRQADCKYGNLIQKRELVNVPRGRWKCRGLLIKGPNGCRGCAAGVCDMIADKSPMRLPIGVSMDWQRGRMEHQWNINATLN